MAGSLPLLLALTLAAAGSVPAIAGEAASASATYTNPVLNDGADPVVIIHNETYYLYSTNTGNCVFTSKDLVHWAKGPCLLPDNFKGLWAPDVYHHPGDGKFYLYYAMKYKIGVAVASQPEGPYTDLGILAVPGIDPHLFRDDDGRLYLYFTHTPLFTMYCVPMKSPTETGGPVTKCFEISQDWEKHSFAINEGPWMEKRDGKYTLLYAGSNGQSIYYAVGVAFAPTPIGPFTKYDRNPVFQDLGKINGSGHGSVTRDRAGQLWHVYAQKRDPAIGWKRDICIDRMAYDQDGVLRGTPTRGVEQPAPACAPDLVWSPDIHPRGAIFNKTVQVSLSSRTDNAEIRYTMDGTEPGASSSLYKKPLTLSQTATVRAKAFKTGMKTSAVAAMLFTRTKKKLPENSSPNAAPGDFPFDVFPQAVIDWKSQVKKPINLTK
jgi:GH43 family beta-xylosidase